MFLAAVDNTCCNGVVTKMRNDGSVFERKKRQPKKTRKAEGKKEKEMSGEGNECLTSRCLSRASRKHSQAKQTHPFTKHKQTNKQSMQNQARQSKTKRSSRLPHKNKRKQIVKDRFALLRELGMRWPQSTMDDVVTCWEGVREDWGCLHLQVYRK